jgi:hypothetical protein
MLMNSRGGSSILRGGTPLGTISMDLAVPHSFSKKEDEEAFLHVPCGPSMMDYPETSGNQPQRFLAGLRQVSKVFICMTFFSKFFLLIEKFGNLPETFAAGFRRFPEVSG